MKKSSANFLQSPESGAFTPFWSHPEAARVPEMQSPPFQPKFGDEEECEALFDKENVSPCETAYSITTPLKTEGIHQWHSTERTPLSDISHHFGPRKKVT